jgi:hypothetical protein
MNTATISHRSVLRRIALGAMAFFSLSTAACPRQQAVAPAQLAKDSLRPVPAAASTCGLQGWVDLHAHPMSYLGFGGKVIAGGVDVNLPLPADASCTPNVTATSWSQALGNDNAIHGKWDPNDLCGDDGRFILVPQFEHAQHDGVVAEPNPGSETGAPSFAFWPAWADMLHQKMWIDWILRARASGQRVMVAL